MCGPINFLMMQIFCSHLSVTQLNRTWFVLLLKTLLHPSQNWCVANNSLGKTITGMSEQDSHSIEKILLPFG